MAHFERISKKKPSPCFALNIIKNTKQPETEYWDLEMCADDLPYAIYDVDKTSHEGQDVVQLIMGNCPVPRKCKIKKIERIQNPFLMASFLIQKERVVAEFGNKVVSNRLLHGTLPQHVDNILIENFNKNMIKRHRYGHGIYFTEDIVFASKFCKKGYGKKELIVANVLESNVCNGNSDMQVPDMGYDTSHNVTPNRRQVWVKYDDNTFYPAYIVTFSVALNS